MNTQNRLKVVMLGPSLSQSGGIANNEKLFLEYAPPDVTIHHIATHEEGTLARKILVFAKALLSLLGILLEGNVDLVHIRISQRGSALRQAITTFLVGIFRNPIIIQAHGSEFHLFYSNLIPLGQKVLAWVFRRCSYFIVLSESWKQFYTKNLGLTSEQVVVLYNPVKLPSQVPHRSNSNKVNLLFLGRIGQRKGAFDLIQAFSQLSSECKSCSSLVIAGDGDIEQAHSLVKRLNLTDYITLPGWVNTEERDTLLTKADIFILPSYNEGLPLAMLEAMAWGLPVIVTPVGGIPEIVTNGENGLLFNPGSIEELLEAMISLIKDETLRLALGSKARTSVVPLSIQNYWVSFLDVYRSVSK